MELTIESKRLIALLASAVEIGFKKGLIIGPITKTKIKLYISKAQAYKLYDRRNVTFWIDKNLIKEIKDGDNTATIRLDRIQLEIEPQPVTEDFKKTKEP